APHVAGQTSTLGHRELRHNFLLEMSRRAADISGERDVCAFVCEGAALLLDCSRTSIMLHDPPADALRIAASVGIHQDIAEATLVRPGEGISGKVFQSGREMFVGAGDTMPLATLRVGALKNSSSFLSVPLSIPVDGSDDARVLGVLNLTRKIVGSGFTPDDLELVRAVASHTAAQIHKCRLIKGERRRRHLEEELKVAAEIQLRLLPSEPLLVGPLHVAGACHPAAQVGGDFLDFWVHDNRVCMLLADVSGHDLGAGLVATALRSVVRSESYPGRSVANLTQQVNRIMNGDLERSERLITLCYLELELETQVLNSCCCGHPYPLLLRAGQPIWLTEGGPLLGISEEVTFEMRQTKMAHGDIIVLYTDGVIEAGFPANQPFGTERLLRAVKRDRDIKPAMLADRVIKAVREYVGSTELDDDVAVLTAHYTALV
ncbi:MAG: SpoIIE family protein phosphatase, partial [Candidatus Brocadiia bacterium]|nr:SpoIIE family protein phosphatase [Candidatus Brocadiia bacterium]